LSKILFWIDSNLLSFFVSYYLQKKIDDEFFALIDITNKPKKFFQEQNIVKFTKSWFYHEHINTKLPYDEDYLKHFEKKYHINLWELSQNERIFNSYNEYYKFSKDEILSILTQECKLFDDILSKTKPDFLIIRETALHHDFLLHKMCKLTGVKILMLNQSKFGYKCLLSEDLHHIDNLKNLNDIPLSGRTFNELETYLNSHNYSSQLISYKNELSSSKFNLLRSSIKYLLSSNSNTKTHYTYFGRSKIRVLIKELSSIIKTKLRENFINKILTNSIPEEKFILFTLHMEPERSLLLAAPLFTNQLETVKSISKSIPIDYKLFVKEHYSQSIRGWRESTFYKELSSLPNVVLIHPSYSTKELIQKSSLVISVGGSVSFEACFYEKPSIIFADLGFKLINSVLKLDNFEELSSIIRKALEIKPKIEDLDRYVTALDSHSFEYDLWGFQLKFFNEFFYNGKYVDVEIPSDKMKNFLIKEKEILENLSEQYLKKINETKSI